MKRRHNAPQSAYAVVPEIAALWQSPAVERHTRRSQSGHEWRQWGADEAYERCATCGATRQLAVKQGELFA